MTELEKLLDKIYWHADAQGTAQAQILSDFAEKDKRIAELEKKYEAYKISNYDPSESIRLNGEIMHQKNRIAELEAQVEKLKCCGNCTSFMIDDHHVLYCENDVYPFPILGKCDRWEASAFATRLSEGGDMNNEEEKKIGRYKRCAQGSL